jgi:hypothetical protein
VGEITAEDEQFKVMPLPLSGLGNLPWSWLTEFLGSRKKDRFAAMPTRRNRHARPDAILFLPGFVDPWEGDMVEGLGERFEVALKRNTSAPLDFHREVSAKQFPHPFGTTKLVKLSVSARGNNQREELAHLYVLDLSAQLIDRYWAAGTQRKALEILFLIARLTPKVVKAFSRNRNLEAIITSIFGALVLIMMLVGLLILGATLLLGFGTLAQFDSTLLSGPVKWALLASAAVTGVLAARPQVRRFFVSFTTICLGLINYAAAGERKNVVVGSLASFLVHLTQDGSYKRIHSSPTAWAPLSLSTPFTQQKSQSASSKMWIPWWLLAARRKWSKFTGLITSMTVIRFLGLPYNG